VVYDEKRNILVLSIDNVHEPGSKTQVRGAGGPAILPLQVFDVISGTELQGERLRFDSHIGDNVSASGHVLKEASVDWTSLLYGLENLRKRGGED